MDVSQIKLHYILSKIFRPNIILTRFLVNYLPASCNRMLNRQKVFLIWISQRPTNNVSFSIKYRIKYVTTTWCNIWCNNNSFPKILISQNIFQVMNTYLGSNRKLPRSTKYKFMLCNVFQTYLKWLWMAL